MKRVIAYVLGILVSLMLVLAMLMTNIDLVANSDVFFEEEYTKLSTAKAVGMSQEDLMAATRHLVRYMRGQEEDLRIKAKINGHTAEVYSKEDRAHMVDVKNLYVFWLRYSFAVYGFAALTILFIALTMRRETAKILSRCFLYGTLVFVLLFAVLGVWIAMDFNSFWIAFHRLFFTNDLWILDPATSLLIQMVPEQFFFDIVVRILTGFATAVGTLLLLSIGSVLYRRWRGKELLAVRQAQEANAMPEEVIERYLELQYEEKQAGAKGSADLTGDFGEAFITEDYGELEWEEKPEDSDEI